MVLALNVFYLLYKNLFWKKIIFFIERWRKILTVFCLEGRERKRERSVCVCDCFLWGACIFSLCFWFLFPIFLSTKVIDIQRIDSQEHITTLMYLSSPVFVMLTYWVTICSVSFSDRLCLSLAKRSYLRPCSKLHLLCST